MSGPKKKKIKRIVIDVDKGGGRALNYSDPGQRISRRIGNKARCCRGAAIFHGGVAVKLHAALALPDKGIQVAVVVDVGKGGSGIEANIKSLQHEMLKACCCLGGIGRDDAGETPQCEHHRHRMQPATIGAVLLQWHAFEYQLRHKTTAFAMMVVVGFVLTDLLFNRLGTQMI